MILRLVGNRNVEVTPRPNGEVQVRIFETLIDGNRAPKEHNRVYCVFTLDDMERKALKAAL